MRIKSSQGDCLETELEPNKLQISSKIMYSRITSLDSFRHLGSITERFRLDFFSLYIYVYLVYYCVYFFG